MLEVLKTELISIFIRFILAILAWIIGSFGIKKIMLYIYKLMEKKNIELSLRTFTRSLLNSVLYIILLIILISILGVQTSSLVAVLGASVITIGLALQGSLSNFAGGILIIIFKPFKVGDFIEAGSHLGTVKEIQIFSTLLDTPDNRRIIIPNAQLSNNTIMNYSKNDLRRLDFVLSVSYDDDLSLAKETIEQILRKQEFILKDKDIFVKLSEYAGSSINFFARAWVKKEDYWTVYYDVLDSIKGEFDKAGLSIPYPQMDVHIKEK